MRIKLILSAMCLIGILGMKVNAQSIVVKGVVQSNAGDVLSGVTIISPGKTSVSDGQGNFSVEIPKGTALTFSYIGMVSKTISYTQNSNVTITLIQEAATDEAVVVVGYGTKKRSELSTAVSSINSKEINSVVVADAAQALQGKVSGVTIVQGSGAPGGTGGTGIRIRGISSLTGTNEPLIVIDGYPLPDQGSNNILNSFGTGDIETITVLKDAAATAIYGVRASNGVIVITTKRGKAGRSNLGVQVYRGIQQAWKLPKSLDAKEYAILNTEARVASGLAPIAKLLDYKAIETQYGKGTDWLDLIFRRAAITNATINASGGSEKAQYAFSAGYFKQDGIVYKTDFERFNLRFNGDIKVSDRIKFGNSLTLTKIVERAADTYTPFNSVVILALTAPPTVKAKNDDGSYAGGQNDDDFAEPNPIYQLEVPQNVNNKYRVNASVYGEVKITKSLTFKTQVGGDFIYQEFKGFSPATPSSGGRPITITSYGSQKSFNTDYVIENTLAYSGSISAKHKITGLVGQSFQENRFSFLQGSRSGNFNLPVLNNQVFIPITLDQISNGGFDGIGSRFLSYFARLNYDFDNRGFFGFSLRQDASSFFAPKNRLAYFPAISAAWRLTKEPFLADVDWLNDLKVRGSFGYTGNPTLANNGPGNPAYLQLINQSFQYTFGNSNGATGTVPGSAVSRTFNPDIQWEKNEQLNIGIDAAVLKNRMNVSLDVYQRRSKNLILYVSPPLLSGTFESVPFNTGTMQNRGVDLTIGATVAQAKGFDWNSNLVLGAYKNEVISLGVSAPLDAGFTRITGGSRRTTQGSPADYFFGFVADGIFQSYDEIAKHAVQTAGTDPTTSTAPGDIRFKDLNNDGVINDKDRENIGNSNPTFTYGFTNNFKYKNFELNIFIQGSEGNRVLNFNRWYTEGGVSNGNYSNKVIGRWNGPGSSNDQPRLTLNDPNGNNRVSSRFVEDASYLRIKNVILAYNLPKSLLSKAKIAGNTQVYVSSQNLLTITNYTGFDPEVGGGVDYGFYPQARTIIAGIKFDL